MPAPLSAVVLRGVVELLATGLSPVEVARRTGVSKSKLYRLQHSMGGMYRIPQTLHSSRFLSLDDRCEIARLRDAGLTVRQVADRLGRAPATISRELRRNVRVRTGGYEPARADRLSWERRWRPKPSKLSKSPELREKVQAMLAKHPTNPADPQTDPAPNHDPKINTSGPGPTQLFRSLLAYRAGDSLHKSSD